MQRRSGFTLVEVLVAMALTLFIMSILSAAFVAATQAFTDLKSSGDLAEKLRGAANVLKRDLEADHIYSDSQGQSPVRLGALERRIESAAAQSGFFRIYQGTPDADEGLLVSPGPPPVYNGDLDGIHSYYQTQASLHYTIGLSGNKRSDFLSASIPANSPLISGASPVYPSPDNYYQDTAGNFNWQTAEVAVFLVPVPTGDQTDGTAGPAGLPLFALYRRQFLPVPSGWPPTPVAPALPITVPATQAPNYLEMSIVPNPGEPSAATNLTFNSLSDLSKPVRRFWMDRNSANKAAGVFPSAAQPPAGRYANIGDVASTASLKSADLLLTDVVSFDVRILLAGDTEFRELYDPQVQAFSGGNPAFYSAANPSFAAVFDTWTNQDDVLTSTPYSTAWNNPWQTAVAPATSPAATTATIPLYQTRPATGSPQAISIQAIQIVVRVWDFKTKKTRQATIVQQM